MNLRRFAGALLGVGLFAATLAYGAFSIRATAFDPNRVAASAATVLRADPVRQSLEEKVSAAIQSQIGSDPSERASADVAAATVVRDPRFVKAFGDALGRFSQQLFDGASQAIVLDAQPVTAAARDALAKVSPDMAARVPPDVALSVTVPTDHVPDLAGARNEVGFVLHAALALALVAIAAGLVLHTRRLWAMARVGRWLFTIGFLQLVGFWLVPRLLLDPMGDAPAVAGALIEGTMRSLLGPAIGMIVAGGALMFACTQQQHLRARRPSVAEVGYPRPAVASVAAPTADDLLPSARP